MRVAAAVSQDELRAALNQSTAICRECLQDLEDGFDHNTPLAEFALAAADACGPGLTSGQTLVCTNDAELNALLEQPDLNLMCCDSPGEDCSSGVPTTCDAQCAHVLLPIQRAVRACVNCARDLT